MLPIVYQLAHKPVLVIGGGDVATGRVERLVRANATVTVVAPDVTPEIRAQASENRIHWIEREYETNDLFIEEWAMVLTAIDKRALSIEIADAARKLRIPVNAADIPESCDFYFGSTVERDSFQILISTNGSAPRLSVKLRKALETLVDELHVSQAISNVAEIRKRLREAVPGTQKDTVKSRMSLMSEFCDSKSFPELARIYPSEIVGIAEALAKVALNALDQTDRMEQMKETNQPNQINHPIQPIQTNQTDPEPTNQSTNQPEPWQKLTRVSVQCHNNFPEDQTPEPPGFPYIIKPFNEQKNQ